MTNYTGKPLPKQTPKKRRRRKKHRRTFNIILTTVIIAAVCVAAIFIGIYVYGLRYIKIDTVNNGFEI